ncbi:MAG: hypothetical protein QOG34_495 [Frankiaceae bacterium]|nr:hypothetical protein [Frankiaceae bacterium]
MKVRRVLAIGAIALAAMCQAVPASAVFSGGATATCGYWQEQQCSGFAQDVPGVGSAGSDVEVTCSATTPYVVQATVVQCFIWGNNGDTHYTTPTLTEGQASTQTYRFSSWELSSRSYIVCVGAGTFDGTYNEPSNFVCNPGI